MPRLNPTTCAVCEADILSARRWWGNNRGQIAVLVVLLAPLFALLLVLSAEFCKQIITKIKLQATLDQAIFNGAKHLTNVLNQVAKANREVHEEFLALQRSFKRLSKPSQAKAKKEIDKTWQKQNKIFDETIVPQISQANQQAYQIAQATIAQEFPKAQFIPFYFASIQMGEGRTEFLPFGEIKGITFDPKGYRRVASKDFEARYAFVKNDDPQFKAAIAGGVEQEMPGTFLPLRAVAAAQPYGGSIWGYALSKEQQQLYRTALVPLKTLPQQGFKNLWKDLHPYAVEH